MASPINPPRNTQSKYENKEGKGISDFRRPISSPGNPKIEEAKPKRDRQVSYDEAANWFYPEAPENKYDDVNKEKNCDLDSDKDDDVYDKNNDEYKDDDEMTPPPSPLRQLAAARTPHLNRRLKSNFVTPGRTPFSYNPLHVAPTPTPYKTQAAGAEREHVKSA
ncbi:hypothetical protein SUGI_0045700 [Cryptomeria japonica]|nr:hypothetical protein SUGI_0045700 [Cryptomeria japonica]